MQVEMTSGPSWESATYREVDTVTSFELLIRVLAPAERSGFAFGENDSPAKRFRRWSRERGVA